MELYRHFTTNSLSMMRDNFIFGHKDTCFVNCTVLVGRPCVLVYTKHARKEDTGGEVWGLEGRSLNSSNDACPPYKNSRTRKRVAVPIGQMIQITGVFDVMARHGWHGNAGRFTCHLATPYQLLALFVI